MFPFPSLQLAGQGLDIEWLLAGPGGGGGGSATGFPISGGGADAGDLLQGKQHLNPGDSWTVVIGPPGAGVLTDDGMDGGNSTFGPHTAHGGLHGRFGSGRAGDGAGGPGFLLTPGPGVISSISGAPVTYCAGGPPGSGAAVTPPGPGSGGAGSYAATGDGAGDNGRASTCVVDYAGTTARATGGTITHIGGRTQHTFNATDTFTVLGGAPAPPPPPPGGELDFEDPAGTGVGLAGGIL